MIDGGASARPATTPGSSADLAQRIGDWAEKFKAAPSRLARIKASIRDFVGCVAAGAALPEVNAAISLAPGGHVPVWGRADSFDPAGAALVAGTAGSLLQLHDVYGPGSSHPSSPVISAAWSTFHHVGGVSAEDFAGAVAAGYETANRIAAACVPAQLLAGSSPTGTAGALGAAVAAAKIRRLNAAGIGRAISNAALLLPATPFAAMRAHGALVPLHAGLAARAGYEAANLAREADSGHHILEGDRHGPGLIALLRGDTKDIEPERWGGETIDSIGWKFFPACLATHVALEAALRMDRVAAKDIERVVVRRPDSPLNSMVDNGPGDGCLYDRLMSLRWVLARSLLLGCYQYPAAISNSPATLALAQKIELISDSRPGPETGGEFWTTLEIYVAGRLHACIDHRRPVGADPTSPGPRGWTMALDEPALQAKFALLTDRARMDPEHLRVLDIL
jgi:2-methylcitrate dehydratase PrpD